MLRLRGKSFEFTEPNREELFELVAGVLSANTAVGLSSHRVTSGNSIQRTA
jgi:hypothetical protein